MTWKEFLTLRAKRALEFISAEDDQEAWTRIVDAIEQEAVRLAAKKTEKSEWFKP